MKTLETPSDGGRRRETASPSRELLFAHRHRGGAGHPDCTEYPVSALPANLTKYDISASKLYSITSNTKVVVNALEEDVTIYWIVQSGEEDAVIENLLGKYESLSDHITVVKKNPDVYPTSPSSTPTRR